MKAENLQPETTTPNNQIYRDICEEVYLTEQEEQDKDLYYETNGVDDYLNELDARNYDSYRIQKALDDNSKGELAEAVYEYFYDNAAREYVIANLEKEVADLKNQLAIALSVANQYRKGVAV